MPESNYYNAISHSSNRNLKPTSSMSQFIQQPSVTVCEAHSDEHVTYYCFTCRCNPICPECIINGPHKGHEVK